MINKSSDSLTLGPEFTLSENVVLSRGHHSEKLHTSTRGWGGGINRVQINFSELRKIAKWGEGSSAISENLQCKFSKITYKSYLERRFMAQALYNGIQSIYVHSQTVLGGI